MFYFRHRVTFLHSIIVSFRRKSQGVKVKGTRQTQVVLPFFKFFTIFMVPYRVNDLIESSCFCVLIQLCRLNSQRIPLLPRDNRSSIFTTGSEEDSDQLANTSGSWFRLSRFLRFRRNYAMNFGIFSNCYNWRNADHFSTFTLPAILCLVVQKQLAAKI